MTSSLSRLLAFAQRFVIGAHDFGVLGALKVLWFFRARIPAQPASVWLKRPASGSIFEAPPTRA